MKIYIGYDFDKNPIGVLLADSQDKAEIAWAAMNDDGVDFRLWKKGV